MIRHSDISDADLHALLKKGALTFAGHKSGKIFGRLDCASGKRMKRGERVFFADASEALALGYRHCGHCMKDAYAQWKRPASRCAPSGCT
jgi:methylphosphotriester-DNA--protein-cysteine methyltransferase